MAAAGPVNVRMLVRRSVPLTCAWYLLDDWRAARRLRAGDIRTDSGRRHAGADLAASLSYIERVHADYLRYGGLERFSGRVAEIGPGDNFGVALLALGDGADEVHAIDRYRSRRDPERQRAIYAALAERRGLARLFDGAPAEETLRGVRYHAGEPAEVFFRRAGLAFDAIVSRAVLEHLYDPLGALDDMAAALRPGGRLIHRIDLRDHGMFAGMHPLTFLTVPEAFYRRMVEASGRPNRVLVPGYRDWLRRSGLVGSVRISRLAGVAEEFEPAPWDEFDPVLRRRAEAAVAEIRPRLDRRFRTLPTEDLAAAGCVVVARKEAGRGP